MNGSRVDAVPRRGASPAPSRPAVLFVCLALASCSSSPSSPEGRSSDASSPALDAGALDAAATDAAATVADSAPHDAAPHDAGTSDGADGALPIAIGEFSGDSFGTPPDSLDAYIALVGHKPVYGMLTEGWQYPLYYSSEQASFASHGVDIVITWSPDATLDGGAFALADVVSGSYDGTLDAAAAKAKAWNGTLYIRMMHEMNGTWSSYAPGVNGNTAAQFVAAWRYVVNRFEADGVTNVKWIWSPNVVLNATELPFDPLYPGDDVVDVVALDGYNFGLPNDPWLTAAQVFQSSYTDLAALTAKPLWIAEWGCGEMGGDKASWITDFFFTQIPSAMPRVRAVVAWNQDGTGSSASIALDSSAAALAAYEQVLGSPMYASP